MPIIVYKTMDLSVHYVQAHRIVCANCSKTFNYVVKADETFTVTGLPLVSGDDSMRQSALKQAKAKLRKVAQQERRGEALCPHCRCYQDWMVRRSMWSGIGCGFLLGAALMAAAAPLAGWALGLATNYGAWVVAGLALGAVGGMVLGKRSALTAGPHPDKEDHRAMTDEDFKAFLTACAEKDAEPILTWFAMISDERPGEKQLWITLGHKDFTHQPIFPEEIDSDVIINQWE